MSLYKQIQIMIATLLLVTLIVVLRIHFNDTREYTAKQLFIHAKNFANVLAVSLSDHTSDKIFIESSINAIFDGGCFETIILTDPNGDVLFNKTEKFVLYGVPKRFIEFVNLQIPFAEVQVISGWSIMGKLQVKAQSGPSYLTLWELFKKLCLIFVFLGTVTIFLSSVVLRYLLDSLVDIQHQAEAISNNQFIINNSIPRTPELKKVVVAMNTMVEKVQLIFSRQLDNLKNYQEINFRDSNTGLNNRKFLVNQLNHFLDSDNEKAQGHMFIMSLTGMESMNISVCHPVFDSFFNDLATIITEETDSLNDAVTARLPCNEYAVIIPNCPRETGQIIANIVMKRVLNLISGRIDLLGMIRAHGGLASYGYGDDVKKVLSKTDYALSVAKSGPSGTIEVFHEDSGQAILGKFEWKTLIEDALSKQRFVLTSQPVISDTHELHREIYVNMIDEHGVHHKASYFMPMVITLGLANNLDHYVLEKTAAFLTEHREHVIAVNITRDFCVNRVSFMWLRQFLAVNKALNENFVFEIHEETLIQHPGISLDLAGLFNGMGYRFGIDQFTMKDASLDLLKNLNPQYIKVEQIYLQDMDNQKEAEIALNALITITDSLNIKLIAVKIENDEQRQALAAMHINYFQGRGVADIAPLFENDEL